MKRACVACRVCKGRGFLVQPAIDSWPERCPECLGDGREHPWSACPACPNVAAGGICMLCFGRRRLPLSAIASAAEISTSTARRIFDGKRVRGKTLVHVLETLAYKARRYRFTL